MGSRAGLGVDDELPHAYANARVDALAKHRGFPHGEPSERQGGIEATLEIVPQ